MPYITALTLDEMKAATEAEIITSIGLWLDAAYNKGELINFLLDTNHVDDSPICTRYPDGQIKKVTEVYRDPATGNRIGGRVTDWTYHLDGSVEYIIISNRDASDVETECLIISHDGNAHRLWSDPLAITDIFARDDGALGGTWTGAAWAISGNAAINTPTVGADLFEPGIYDAGIGSWVPYGTNTVTNDAGTIKITYVNNASGASLQLRATSDLTADMTGWAWYELSFDACVNEGSDVSVTFSNNTQLMKCANVTNTVMQTFKRYFVCRDNHAAVLYTPSMAAGEIIWLDNLTLKPVTLATLFATLPQTQADVIARLGMTINPFYQSGLAINVDNPAAPLNFVLATFDREFASLVKVVAGVGTTLIRVDTSASYGAGRLLEVRKSGTTYSLWYNGAQIGADQTVSDAGIINNKYHGMFGVGGGNANGPFFLGSQLAGPTATVFLGGSISTGSLSSDHERTAFRAITGLYIVHQRMNTIRTYVDAGVGGSGSWYALTRLQADVIAHNPDLVVIDFAVNDYATTMDQWAVESIIRRLRASLPGARLIAFIFPNVTDRLTDDATNTHAVQAQNWRDVAAHYDVDVVDYASQLYVWLAGGAHLTDYYTVDNKHPNDVGHAAAASILNPVAALAGSQWTGDLADYAYLFPGSVDFEEAPIVRTGVDNDGETGPGWSTVGTARQSSTADDTISWIGTFASFSLETNYGGGAGTVAWQVDAGAWTNIDLSTAASIILVSNFARAAHTVTLKVIAGTVQIITFLAI